MSFKDRPLNANGHFFTFRPLRKRFPNLGYFRTKTPKATVTLYENMATQAKAKPGTIRVWHTRRLWITWEGKRDA